MIQMPEPILRVRITRESRSRDGGPCLKKRRGRQTRVYPERP